MERIAGTNESRMQLIRSRTVTFLDSETLVMRAGREALFRNDAVFMLYLSDGQPGPLAEERIIKIGAREALIWLNEGVDETGSFWA